MDARGLFRRIRKFIEYNPTNTVWYNADKLKALAGEIASMSPIGIEFAPLIAPEQEKLARIGFEPIKLFCSRRTKQNIDNKTKIVLEYKDTISDDYGAEIIIDWRFGVVYSKYYDMDPYSHGRWSKEEFEHRCPIRKKHAEELWRLRAENAALAAENEQLRAQIEYQPGGPGYLLAREHFGSLASNLQ